MTEPLTPNTHHALLPSEPKPFSQAIEPRDLRPSSTLFPHPTYAQRSGHLNLDNFSPVDQNGSFAFDKVLKSGEIHKRTRKTKVDIMLAVLLKRLLTNNLSNGNPST